MDSSKYCASPPTRRAEARNWALKSAVLAFTAAVATFSVLAAADWTFCHTSAAIRPGSVIF